MRIYTGQTTHLFQAAAINHSINKNRPGKEEQAGTPMRMDMAFISPQGKSSGLLANLMSQKELIQSNKEYLLTKALDEENAGGAAGLQEQLEDYEKQLDSLNEQIAAELAKQMEHGGAQEAPGQKPQTEEASGGKATVSDEEEQAQVRREGEKRVCEAEIELGGVAAEWKLDKINEIEKMTEKWAPVLKRLGR